MISGAKYAKDRGFVTCVTSCLLQAVRFLLRIVSPRAKQNISVLKKHPRNFRQKVWAHQQKGLSPGSLAHAGVHSYFTNYCCQIRVKSNTLYFPSHLLRRFWENVARVSVNTSELNPHETQVKHKRNTNLKWKPLEYTDLMFASSFWSPQWVHRSKRRNVTFSTVWSE